MGDEGGASTPPWTTKTDLATEVCLHALGSFGSVEAEEAQRGPPPRAGLPRVEEAGGYGTGNISPQHPCLTSTSPPRCTPDTRTEDGTSTADYWSPVSCYQCSLHLQIRLHGGWAAISVLLVHPLLFMVEPQNNRPLLIGFVFWSCCYCCCCSCRC